VDDPLFLRKNTGDNTPAIIHARIVPGDKVHIIVSPKGCGSENMGALRMLKPADGVDGVIKFVLETITNAGSNPCPPVTMGIGIGGNMERAAELAKFP
jgi:fumarate hydratase subunit alpha